MSGPKVCVVTGYSADRAWCAPLVERSVESAFAKRRVEVVKPQERVGKFDFAGLRNEQRRVALAQDCTHVYFHDADMLPPAGIVDRLLALDAPLASGVYPIRAAGLPLLPCVMHAESGLPLAAQAQTLLLGDSDTFVAEAFGFGCMLVRRDVLERIAFRTAPDGEDYAFCRDGGGRVVVDGGASCWHVDSDGAAGRIVVGDLQCAAVWNDPTAWRISTHVGEWHRGVARFDLSPALVRELGTGFTSTALRYVGLETGRASGKGEIEGVVLATPPAPPVEPVRLPQTAKNVDGDLLLPVCSGDFAGGLVSVLVPWYEGEPWRAQLEATLVAQSYTNWECVVVGDGCDPGQFSDRRFRVSRIEHAGIAAATNHAASLANGQYFLLLDQDDELHPECIEALVRCLEARGDWAGVIGREEFVYPDRVEPDRREGFSREEQFQSHLVGHPVLVRRDAWANIPAGFEPSQDSAWGFVVTDRQSFGFCPRFLYRWNLHGANQSIVRREAQASAYERARAEARRRRAAEPTICFVLPALSMSGGIRVVVEAARLMHERGRSVCIADTSGRWGNDLARSNGRPYDVGAYPRSATMWNTGDVPIWDRVPQCTDLALATCWTTPAAALAHERAGGGKAGWLMFDWESGWGADRVQADPGISRIVCLADWLPERLLREWGRSAELAPMGFDATIFPATRRRRPAQMSVLLTHRYQAHKNPDGTSELARAILKEGWRLTIVAPEPPRGRDLDLAPHWRMNVAASDMGALYGEHSHFVSRSYQEGWFIMAAESMRMGAVPVVGLCGTDHVEGCGVRLDPDADESAWIAGLRQAWEQWPSLSRAGQQRAAGWTWEARIPALERMILQLAD